MRLIGQRHEGGTFPLIWWANYYGHWELGINLVWVRFRMDMRLPDRCEDFNWHVKPENVDIYKWHTYTCFRCGRTVVTKYCPK